MKADFPSVHHPHMTRRCVAAAAALFCTLIWLMVYSALWHAEVTQHWLHHLILLAVGTATFAIPCLAVWLIARGYDRARTFRGL